MEEDQKKIIEEEKDIVYKGEDEGFGVTEEKSNSANNRLYHNKPKILLEVISANTIWGILFLTYSFFCLGFLLDVQSTVTGFTSSNFDIGTNDCNDIYHKNATWVAGGCQVTNETEWLWIGIVTELTNVVSTQLIINVPNVTGSIIGVPHDAADSQLLDQIELQYSTKLYCCYSPHGCGSSISTGTAVNAHSWSLVLNEGDETTKLSNYDSNSDSASAVLFGYVFQNQEALPTRGRVQSYFVAIQVTQIGKLEMNAQTSIADGTYTFNVLTRPKQAIQDVCSIILLSLTLLVFATYVYILRYYTPKKLPEQKWLVLYFIALILYQNPVYCIAVLQNQKISESVAFTCYIIEAVAQAMFFSVWLLFADGVRRKSTKTTSAFYGPKLAFGLFVCIIQVAIYMVQFVSLYPAFWTSDRSSVEAVHNWKQDVQTYFFTYCMIFFSCVIIFLMWWYYSLRCTGQKLAVLPYMNTRYLQLSYRFFYIQANLVAIYYAFQYALILFFILYKTTTILANNDLLIENMTNVLNTLFRESTQIFGKIVFLTVYAFILAFLFLPVSILETDAFAGFIASTFVITEEEMKEVVGERRKILHKIEEPIRIELKLAAVTAAASNQLNKLTNAKAEVFCVDVGLMLLSAAYEAYYDPPDLKTVSGFGEWNIERHGFELVDVMYVAAHETFCYVVRVKADNSLIVAFRGTSSAKHWNDNLNYSLIPLDLYAANPALDAMDVLDSLEVTVKKYEGLKSEIDQYEQEQKDLAKWEDQLSTDQDAAHSEEDNNLISNVAHLVSNIGTKGAEIAIQGAGALAGTVGDVTNAAVNSAAKTTANVSSSVSKFVNPHLHNGFWDAYMCVRYFVHGVVRREYAKIKADEEIPHLYFAGHSLGGAIATIASADVTINSLPRINKYLKVKRFLATRAEGRASDQIVSRQATEIAVSMYNFGSPRIFNQPLTKQFNELIPDSFRVAVDGDLVTGIPSGWGYKHVGTEILVDSIGSGSIIIDPSAVERRLRNSSKTSVSVHSLLVYRKALLCIKEASNSMKTVVGDDILSHTLSTFRRSSDRGRTISGSFDADAIDKKEILNIITNPIAVQAAETPELDAEEEAELVDENYYLNASNVVVLDSEDQSYLENEGKIQEILLNSTLNPKKPKFKFFRSIFGKPKNRVDSRQSVEALEMMDKSVGDGQA